MLQKYVDLYIEKLDLFSWLDLHWNADTTNRGYNQRTVYTELLKKPDTFYLLQTRK